MRSHRQPKESEHCDHPEKHFEPDASAEEDGLKKPATIEWQERQKIEAVQDQKKKCRRNQCRVRCKKGDQSQDHADGDARQRTHERDDRFLVSGNRKTASGHSGAEEGDEEHLHVAVLEGAHSGIVTELVDEQDANETEKLSRVLPTHAGSAECHNRYGKDR